MGENDYRSAALHAGLKDHLASGMMYRRLKLASLLDEAAELEHGLCCQYLFAACTMKKDPSEGGVTVEQLESMRAWERDILLVARQEMEHLGLVCNLLTAIGEAPHLSRPDFPLSSEFYPANVESTLERFCEAAVLRWILFEMPDKISLRTEATLKKWVGPHFTRPDYDTIGQLYDEIEKLFEQLDDEMAGRLFIGPRSAQFTTNDILPIPIRGISVAGKGKVYGVSLTAVTDLASAKEVIAQIKEEGEGSPEHTEDGHFGKFFRMYEQLTSERARDPDFEPARAVRSNPRTRREGWGLTPDNGPDSHVITDVATNELSKLFDLAYETMMLMLMRYFAHSDETQAELAALQQTAFFPLMTTVIRPVAEMLTELPIGDGDGGRAGPSFGFSRRLAYLPHREAAWKMIHMQLETLESAALALSRANPYPHPIKRRLEMVHENVYRMALNFSNAMNLGRTS